MASASDEPLSKEEQEEEEIRNELMSTGFFYESMSLNEMREIWTQLKKSNSQNEELSQRESNSTQNTSENLQPNVDIPLPSFSYKQAASSGDLSIPSTSNEDQLDKREKSIDAASSKSYGKSLNNEDTLSDSETIFEKNFNVNKEDYLSPTNTSGSKTNTFNISRLRPRESNKTLTTKKKERLERWRFNPLLCCEDGDIPLKRPECVHTEQENYLPHSNEVIDSKTFDALCQQLSTKLDSLHEHAIPQYLTRERKTIWGSPIKLPTKWSGLADKSSCAEKAAGSSSFSPDLSIRDTFDRAVKRKTFNTAAFIQNDENSDEEFSNTKKRKLQQKKTVEEVPRKNQENTSNKNPIEMIEVDQINDLSNSELFDNTDLKSLYKSKCTKTSGFPQSSTSLQSVENSSSYPRRITPPNPAKKNYKGPRQKKKNLKQLRNNANKNNNYLDDEEITTVLHDADGDDNDCIEITEEVKPSLNLKSIPHKIHEAHSYLESIRTISEQKIKAEEEERKQKEIKERLQKDELISKRLQEEEDEKSRKLEKEKKLHKQESLYKDMFNQNTRVTRATFKRNRNYAEVDEDELLADDDDDEIMLTHSNIVTKICPICQKFFPDDQIFTHASECGLFPSEPNDIPIHQPSSSNSRIDGIYECQICNTYTTSDGKNFEEHMTQCKDQAENQRSNGVYV